MKKFFFSLAFALVSICAFSQVKVSINYPDVDVVFKRCIVKGDIAYLDYMITNNSKEELLVQLGSTNTQTDDEMSAFDDEGNVYRYSDSEKSRLIFKFSLAGHEFEDMFYSKIVNIPIGIPIKGRIGIRNIDEFATQFKLVKITFACFTAVSKGAGGYPEKATIVLKNVPFVRQ